MTQRWTVIAAFFSKSGGTWLDDFITDDQITFTKVPPSDKASDWHHRKSYRAGLADWLSHLSHARLAFATQPDGIIACFPQLAICCALLKRLTLRRSKKPALIGYNFNLGYVPSGLKRRILHLIAPQIDYVVVHSPTEVAPYADALGLPQERVRFIPLQRGEIKISKAEDTQSPFLLAMGSAGRDYPTLVKSVIQLNIPTVIVTRPDIIETLEKASNITYLSGLTQAECMELLAKCRISVTPISNLSSASGQITFINAMRLGVPLIATDSPGTAGYLRDGETGVLVPPFDTEAMTQAIERLWNDPAFRSEISQNSIAAAAAEFSDEAASARLHSLIKDLQVVA